MSLTSSSSSSTLLPTPSLPLVSARPPSSRMPSERLSLSGAEGQRLNETQNINLSLSSLGNVLACLSRNATIAARRGSSRGTSQGGVGGPARTGETPAPVPYRDSKLTHFLKVRGWWSLVLARKRHSMRTGFSYAFLLLISVRILERKG